jgi:hypothetical protein
MHISTLRADCGPSLRLQNKFGNMKKADARGRDPVFFDEQTQLTAAVCP